LRDNNQNQPADQFLLVEDAAQLLNLDVQLLRQGIACNLVPIRRDNTGTIRVHHDDIPNDLQEKIDASTVQPELQAAALADELMSVKKSLYDSVAHRIRLEELVVKQGSALERYAALLDATGDNTNGFSSPIDSSNIDSSTIKKLRARDAEVEKLSNILERTFKAIETRDQQVAQQTNQLTQTADKAMYLLERAVREGEISAEQLNVLNQQIANSNSTSTRLEHELDQRNAAIDNQHSLIERMLTLAEQSAEGSHRQGRRKRTFWQRLFGGGKGI